MFLTSNHCFQQKYRSSIYNIAFSSAKVVSSDSGERYAQIQAPLQAKTVLNQYVGGFWCERQQRLDFVTGGSVIMDYELMIRPEVVSRSQTFRLPAEGLE